MTKNQIIHQAIEREMTLGKYLLSNYSEKIREFEKKYKMKTSGFVNQFEKGQLGDDEVFFEWLAIYKGKKYWEEKLSALKTAWT